MKNPNFDESMVAELEQTVVAAMEQPTDRKTSMEYTCRVNEEYSIDVELMTYTPDAMPYGMSGHSNRLFVCHDVPSVEQTIIGLEEFGEHECRRPLLFSAVYTEDEDGRQLGGMSGKVKLPFADVLNLSPQDRELAITAGNLSLQLSDGVHFDLEEGQPEWNEQLVQNFLRLTSQAVANGVYIERSYLSSQPDDVELFAAYTTFSGEARYVDQSVLEYPYLRFSVIKDAIETVYERSLTGTVDVKTRIADPINRYSALSSYKLICDEDTGEALACTFDPLEVIALEQEERDSGLYVPTKEQIGELLTYAAMLKQ